MKHMNLEKPTYDPPTLDELLELRGMFEKTLSSTELMEDKYPIAGHSLWMWFRKKGKIYSLRCEYMTDNLARMCLKDKDTV